MGESVAEGGSAVNAWAQLPSRRRGRLRELVFERDGFRCQIGGPGCTRAAQDVDHVVPLARGGPVESLSNLRAACRKCNRAGGARLTNAGRYRPGVTIREW